MYNSLYRTSIKQWAYLGMTTVIMKKLIRNLKNSCMNANRFLCLIFKLKVSVKSSRHSYLEMTTMKKIRNSLMPDFQV